MSSNTGHAPCPFNHGAAGQTLAPRYTDFGDIPGGGRVHYINCNVCGARGPDRGTVSAAWLAWNQRASLSDVKKTY